jgi:hypothetical protein
VVKVLLTVIFSAVKFAATFPLAVMQFKFNFFETILWTNVGGLLGIYFFAFLSEKLIAWWNRTFKKRRSSRTGSARSKKVFTQRNRRIIRIKQKYGLIGIALITPLLLSIPLGTFLAVRYYRSSRTKFIYLIGSNVAWSAIYTSFYMFWDGILFKRG